MQPDISPLLVLTDASKLGTTVNGQRFKTDQRVLSPNDELSFGTTGNNKFRYFNPVLSC